MRGRKRKQSVKAEEEPEEETTGVQESQSTKTSEKFVPSFGKKKKTKSVVDLQREENPLVAEVQKASAATIIAKDTEGAKSTSENLQELSTDLVNEVAKNAERAFTETIQADLDIGVKSNPEISSEAKDFNDLGRKYSRNESKEQGANENDLFKLKCENEMLENDALETANETTERASEQMPSSSQTFALAVKDIRPVRFDPSGDAKQYQSIIKDTQKLTEILGEIDKPTTKENSPKISVIKEATSSETSSELNKNVDKKADVTVLRNTTPTKDDGANILVKNKAPTTDDGANELVRNTAPTTDDGANDLDRNTAPTKDDGANEIVRNTAPTTDDGANEIVRNTAPTTDDGADDCIVVTNNDPNNEIDNAVTGHNKDENTNKTAVVTNSSPSKHDADHSDESPTLKDLSYDEDSQENEVEIHKLIDYHFENFQNLSDINMPVFGFIKDCTDVSLSSIQCGSLQKENSEANESSNSNECFGVSSDTKDKPTNDLISEEAECSKERSPSQTASELPTTSNSFMPPTQGFGIHGIDFPITATQNFNISYSPLMSITPDSSNPGSPESLLEEDVPKGPITTPNVVQGTYEAHLDSKSDIEMESQRKTAPQKLKTRSSQADLDNEKEIGRTDTTRKPFEETSTVSEDSKADNEEQRPCEMFLSKTNQISSEKTVQMSFPIKPSQSKNDMPKQIDQVQNKTHSSVDNTFDDEVMNMEDDFGVSDSQMCAIDYEEPATIGYSCHKESVRQRITQPLGAIPIQGQSTPQAGRPDQEGHTIMQGLIKDISGLNKMLLNTKREMEAFRRKRGYIPLQDRNWQQ